MVRPVQHSPESIVEGAQIQLVMEQVTQCVFEGAVEQLVGKINGKKLQRPIDHLVARYLQHFLLPQSMSRSVLQYAHDRSNIAEDFFHTVVKNHARS